MRLSYILSAICSDWKRLTTSKGYGVQSPFAYAFLQNVIKQPLPYYAYEKLAKTRSKYKECYNSQKIDELLFRLSNYAQAGTVFIPEKGWELSALYLIEGCQKSICNRYSEVSQLKDFHAKPVLICFQKVEDISALLENLPEGSILFFKNLDINKEQWQNIQSEWSQGVIFDMKSSGIIIKNVKITPGSYQIMEIK